MPRYHLIRFNRRHQFALCNALLIGVRDVNRSGPEQQRFSPVAELRNVGGELGDHGRQALDGAHADEGNFEGEVDVGQALGAFFDGRRDRPI